MKAKSKMDNAYISSEDVQLYTEVYGSPMSKDTLILLHGFADSHQTWNNLVDFLNKDYRVICFDIRGFGKSSVPQSKRGFSMEHLVSDLDHVINHYCKDGQKVHLVGHDWGGMIHWSYISIPEYAIKVQSMISLSAPHPAIAINNFFENFRSMNVQLLNESIIQLSRSWYIAFFQIPIVPEMFSEILAITLWEKLLKSWQIPSDDEMYRLSSKEVSKNLNASVNLYRELLQNGIPPLPTSMISVPIAQIIPVKDTTISQETYKNSDKFARHYKRYRIPSGHWVHKEKPYEVYQIIDSHIQDHKEINK